MMTDDLGNTAFDDASHCFIGADGRVSAPLFRREISVEHQIVSATLFIAGLGYHEAWINGKRVGDHVMDPSQTDYERRVLYVRHDVTEMLQTGDNAIGIILGNGWYHQDRVWSAPDPDDPGAIRQGLSYGQPRLMVQLHMMVSDGPYIIVQADEDWRWHEGPITDNNIYAGEHYDARREIPGWCEPGFDDHRWNRAVVLPSPGGKLEEEVMPPMRCVEELQPVEITAQGNAHVVDFGQNFAGWGRIRLEAEAGTEITMRFSESVFPDGSLDTSSTGVFATHVEQIDRYICKGVGVEIWEPRFTYHGFRYVEVKGWPGNLDKASITGVVVHNDLAVHGAFICSDERLNRLHQMALWTHRSNMHGFPEDCPARERCGWLGDANLVTEYSLWNYDGSLFWQKYLDDIETTRAGNKGIPCNVAPGKRCTSGNANPDWGAAFIMLPWYVYQFSGDLAVLKRHWPGMCELMQHFKTRSSDWILPGGYGDYFDPGTDAIVQHTPQTLTTTLWFYRCATVMASMSMVLDDAFAAQQYCVWQKQIQSAVVAAFYDLHAGSFGSQTGNVLALAFGILPKEEGRLLEALVRDIESRDRHMNVGVMGVRYILEVLTRRGCGELALALMRQNTYPSFGHLIERGATTLWECWGEKGHDGTHGPRSLNHPFMGGYDNWFYNTLAGIQPDPESPGFRHFYLHPHPIEGLHWVRCNYDSQYGRIESNWQLENGLFRWNVIIPKGACATALLPQEAKAKAFTAGCYEFRKMLS